MSFGRGLDALVTMHVRSGARTAPRAIIDCNYSPFFFSRTYLRVFPAVCL